MPRKATDPLVRFLAGFEVDHPDECWRWRNPSARGYGQFTAGGKHYMAYRFAYELQNGTIPAGLTVDHLCRNRACVNPAHLEAVTVKENVLRGVGISAKNAKKTVCKNGHPLDVAFLKLNRRNGRVARICRTCRRADDKKRYRVRRALMPKKQRFWSTPEGRARMSAAKLAYYAKKALENKGANQQ